MPIVAGLDKFTTLLTDWELYLSLVARVRPVRPGIFMAPVGVIEIAVGVGRLLRSGELISAVRGLARGQLAAHLVAAAYDLLRISKLMPA